MARIPPLTIATRQTLATTDAIQDRELYRLFLASFIRKLVGSSGSRFSSSARQLIVRRLKACWTGRWYGKR
jgi:hypothetical protein